MRQIPIVIQYRNENSKRLLYCKPGGETAHILVCDSGGIDGNNRNAVIVISENEETNTDKVYEAGEG